MLVMFCKIATKRFVSCMVAVREVISMCMLCHNIGILKCRYYLRVLCHKTRLFNTSFIEFSDLFNEILRAFNKIILKKHVFFGELDKTEVTTGLLGEGKAKSGHKVDCTAHLPKTPQLSSNWRTSWQIIIRCFLYSALRITSLCNFLLDDFLQILEGFSCMENRYFNGSSVLGAHSFHFPNSQDNQNIFLLRIKFVRIFPSQELAKSREANLINAIKKRAAVKI